MTSSDLTSLTCLRSARPDVRQAVDAVMKDDLAAVDLLVGLRQELHTPLTAISGLAQVMRDGGLGPLDNPLYQDCLGDIDECAQHLASLIDEIVARARAERREPALATV